MIDEMMRNLTEIAVNLRPLRLVYGCIEGFSDEMVYLPVCSVCDQPIKDFANANLVVRLEDRDPESAGRINGNSSLSIWPGSVHAVHKSCDHTRLPWCPLTNVLRTQQCWEWDRAEEGMP